MRKKKAATNGVGSLFDWHIGKPRVTADDVVAIFGDMPSPKKVECLVEFMNQPNVALPVLRLRRTYRTRKNK